MGTADKTPARTPRVMGSVRQRIERGGERLWRLEDFRDLPFSAVAQALSRLTREGLIERLSKGVYYRNRATAFGKSRPNPASIRKLASQSKTLFPSAAERAEVRAADFHLRYRRQLPIAYDDIQGLVSQCWSGNAGLHHQPLLAASDQREPAVSLQLFPRAH